MPYTLYTRDHFLIETYKDITIIILKANGYVSVTQICKSFSETKWDGLSRSVAWQQLIQSYRDTYDDEPLIKLSHGIPRALSQCVGTYANPKLIPHVINYCNAVNTFGLMEKLNEMLQSLKSSSESVSNAIISATLQHETLCLKGTAGEEISFAYLKGFFPGLVDNRRTAHSEDFYDPTHNILFEIKSKAYIHSQDYRKVRFDAKERVPKLSVFISNVGKLKTRLEVSPNVLYIHMSEFEKSPDTWRDFIINTDWTKIGPEMDPSTISSETTLEFEELKSKHDEVITTRHLQGLEAFVEEYKERLSDGVTHQQLLEVYKSFCSKHNIVVINKTFADSLLQNDYCITYQTYEHRTSKDTHPRYILKNSPLATSMINTAEQYINQYPTIKGGSKTIYAIYLKEEETLGHATLAMRQFFKEYKRIRNIPNDFIYKKNRFSRALSPVNKNIKDTESQDADLQELDISKSLEDIDFEGLDL